MRDAVNHETDLLDRLLLALNVQVDAFAICEVRRGWRLVLEPLDAPLLHYVLAGSGRLHVADGGTLPLTRQSLVIVPPRSGHSLEVPNGQVQEAHAPGNCSPLADGLMRVRAGGDGGGGADIVVACGIIRASYGGTVGLFDQLDEPIAENVAGAEPLRGAIEALLAELAAPGVGSRAMIEALLKQCLVLLLRRLAEGGTEVPWLAAAAEPRLMRSLAVMLEHPAAPLTLDELAGRTGMSRSSFAGHFAATFGRPPMEFLKEVRLRRAARLLETTRLPIKAVARSVGYTSRSYFSRAFRGLYGVDPTAFRKACRKEERREADGTGGMPRGGSTP